MGCPSAPASIRRRGRFAEHGGLERALLACWSWTEGFWNVPGPGVRSAQRLSSHDASSVISSEDALSWGGLLEHSQQKPACQAHLRFIYLPVS